MKMNWSQPTPVRDGCGPCGGQAEWAGGLVEHDEVGVAVVHLEERGVHGGGYMRCAAAGKGRLIPTALGFDSLGLPVGLNV